jgi:hypothetical protein
VLFTSRSMTAQGMPSATEKKVVPPLSDDAATQVLSAARGLLDKHQLKLVLKFCGGLPLALQLVRGCIEQDRDPGRLQYMVERLAGHTPISHDSSDKLFRLVGDSVKCLSEPLCQIWCEVAVLMGGDVPWSDLEVLYGKDQTRELASRSLLQKGVGDLLGPYARVHDVLLSYAYHQCCTGRGSRNFPILARLAGRNAQDLDMADLVSCYRAVTATHTVLHAQWSVAVCHVHKVSRAAQCYQTSTNMIH